MVGKGDGGRGNAGGSGARDGRRAAQALRARAPWRSGHRVMIAGYMNSCLACARPGRSRLPGRGRAWDCCHSPPMSDTQSRLHQRRRTVPIPGGPQPRPARGGGIRRGPGPRRAGRRRGRPAAGDRRRRFGQDQYACPPRGPSDPERRRSPAHVVDLLAPRRLEMERRVGAVLHRVMRLHAAQQPPACPGRAPSMPLARACCAIARCASACPSPSPSWIGATPRT